jgi:hypothetical protein
VRAHQSPQTHAFHTAPESIGCHGCQVDGWSPNPTDPARGQDGGADSSSLADGTPSAAQRASGVNTADLRRGVVRGSRLWADSSTKHCCTGHLTLMIRSTSVAQFIQQRRTAGLAHFPPLLRRRSPTSTWIPGKSAASPGAVPVRCLEAKAMATRRPLRMSSGGSSRISRPGKPARMLTGAKRRKE